MFLRELQIDANEFWNYEPVYIGALKRNYPEEYATAELKLRGREIEVDQWEDFMDFFEEYLTHPSHE
jgi:hypothetical protein